MATNHTTNYALNLWEANDNFVREEFNENTSKLDAAIKAEADARAAAVTAETTARTAAVDALTQTVAEMSKVMVGCYSGSSSEERIISLGAMPKAVLVVEATGYMYLPSSVSNSICGGGLALPGYPAGNCGSRGSAVEIVTNGFKVKCVSGIISTNEAGHTYYYVAFM